MVSAMSKVKSRKLERRLLRRSIRAAVGLFSSESRDNEVREGVDGIDEVDGVHGNGDTRRTGGGVYAGAQRTYVCGSSTGVVTGVTGGQA